MELSQWNRKKIIRSISKRKNGIFNASKQKPRLEGSISGLAHDGGKVTNLRSLRNKCLDRNSQILQDHEWTDDLCRNASSFKWCRIVDHENDFNDHVHDRREVS